jgi:hypothetical protein
MRDNIRVILVHRQVMGTKPGHAASADRVNGDRLDDRRLNLRFVTAAEYSAGVKFARPAATGACTRTKAHGRKTRLEAGPGQRYRPRSRPMISFMISVVPPKID